MKELDIKWLQEYAEQEKRYKWGKQIKLLLTAYEKEKEKNRKYLVNLTHEQYIKLVEQIRSEINKEWKDIIIAKVIEIKNRPVKDEFITATQGKLNTIIEIESLLEKE